MSRPGWATPYSMTTAPLAAEPCRCFFALEEALDDPDGPFQLASRDPALLRYNEVTLAGVQLVCCPRCGGRCGSWREEAIEAHRRYRDARARCDFLAGRLDPDAVAARCAAIGAVPDRGGPDDIGRSWLDPDNHLSVGILYDYDHACWYGSCSFWPGPDLIRAPLRA